MLHTITKPALLLDEQKCRANIKMMAEKARRNKVELRPHFKTHQSHTIGHWFRAEGVNKITVSSLAMAHYFAQDGWEDITVAFPINIREIDMVNELAAKIKLHILVESVEALEQLEQGLQAAVSIFLKVDIGYRRTGIAPENTNLINALLTKIESQPLFQFSGFLGHAGHSYKVQGVEAIRGIHETSKAAMVKLKHHYISRYPDLIASVGDTPTCSRGNDFGDIDEIRPGNFVFYDLTQWRIGSCTLDQIAVAMACPVVAKHADRSEIIVYGGGVHFSKDQSVLPGTSTPYFGLVVKAGEQGWSIPEDQSYIASLSQEHGIIKASPRLFKSTNVGDLLLCLPIHSCMSANLMKSYLTFSGGEIARLL